MRRKVFFASYVLTHKGESEDMKKLLIMSAIAAMACGAWAKDYEYYSFTLSIYNIPLEYDHLSPNAKVYLIDTTSGNSIIAYGAAKDWDSQDNKLVSKDVTTHISSGTVTFAGYDDTTYTYTEHVLKGGSVITDTIRTADKDVTFRLDFTTTSGEMAKLKGIVDGKAIGYAENLVAIVYDDCHNRK